MKSIYLDNAATSQVRDEVIDAMSTVLKSNYGNASSMHGFGRSSKSIIESCRKRIASHFNALSSEIIFTAGGTEADNLVLHSAVRDLKVTHVITSKIEHHAVLHTIEQLAAEHKITVSYVDVFQNGTIDYQHLKNLLKSTEKTLVSLMHVNNETGEAFVFWQAWIGAANDFANVTELCARCPYLLASDNPFVTIFFCLGLHRCKIAPCAWFGKQLATNNVCSPHFSEVQVTCFLKRGRGWLEQPFLNQFGMLRVVQFCIRARPGYTRVRGQQ